MCLHNHLYITLILYDVNTYSMLMSALGALILLTDKIQKIFPFFDVNLEHASVRIQ